MQRKSPVKKKVSKTKEYGFMCMEKSLPRSKSNIVFDWYESLPAKITPGIIEMLYEYLSDEKNAITGMDKSKAEYAIDKVHKVCELLLPEMLMQSSNRWEKLLPGFYREIYSITLEGANGTVKRIATQGEIEDSAPGLSAEVQYSMGQSKYEKYCLLCWFIYGRGIWLKRAGYKVQYVSGVRESLFDILVGIEDKMEETLEWVRTGEWDKDMSVAKRLVKEWRYRYPEYSQDEVSVACDIKQVIYYLSHLPSIELQDNARAIAVKNILIRIGRRLDWASVVELSLLREAYEEILGGRIATNVYDPDHIRTGDLPEGQSEVMEICNKVRELSSKGEIPIDSFALKVVSTISSRGYRKCSDKQRQVLVSTILKASKKKEDSIKEEEAVNSGMDDMESIYSSLGSGNWDTVTTKCEGAL